MEITRPHRFIRWFVMYMALGGGSFVMFHTILPLRIFHHLILTLILLFWFTTYGLPDSPLLAPLALFLGNVGVAALFAVDQRLALENLWHWFSNLGLFLVALSWFRQGREETVFRAQFVVGGFVVAVCLVEWLLTRERIQGPFFLTNLTGGYAAALVVPVLAWARESKSVESWLLKGVAAALVLSMFFGHNRGAFISLGVALVMVALLNKQTGYKWMVGMVAVGTAMIVGLLMLTTGHRFGDVLRLDTWRAGGEMLILYPTGVGPGLFGRMFREMGTIGDDRMLGAHNLYINIGAELGAVGLAAGAAVLLVFLYYIVGQERTAKQNACLAALTGIGAHMMVDNFPSQNFAFLVGLYVAYVVHEWRLDLEAFPQLLRTLRNGVVVALIVSLVWLLQWDRAQVFYEEGLGGSVASARVAVDLDPQMTLYRIQLDRLLDGEEAIGRWDSTITDQTNLSTYGVVNYGRVFK